MERKKLWVVIGYLMERKKLWVVIGSLVLLSSLALWYFLGHTTTFTATNTGDDGSGSSLDTVGLDSLSVGSYTIQPTVVNLLAGQHIPVGSVTVSSDSTYLYVTYETGSHWQLLETRLAVAETLEGVPQNAGDPQVGLFPYSSIVGNYSIELHPSWTPGTTLYIAAHAVVIGSGAIETTWGEGTRFNEYNWAMYFTYTVQS